jgi:hypothetical protein
MKVYIVAVVVMIFFFGVEVAVSWRSPSQQQNGRNTKPAANTSLDWERFEFEKQKAAEAAQLEAQKLTLDREKLELEKSSVSWTKISSSIPLLVALSTLAYGLWSFSQQSKQQANAQIAATQLQFEMKAAEIAFAGKSPEAVFNRAKALKAIFGDRLPATFPNSYDPIQLGGGKEDPDAKKFFLELLLKYPDKKDQIAKLWEALFGDSWFDRIKPLL